MTLSLVFVIGRRSFPSRSRKCAPWAGSGIPACLAVLILAGCGGGGATSTVQTLAGAGFHFQAPIAWKVIQSGNSVAATHGKVDRVEVLRFKLTKRYNPSRFAAASKELDSVIARIATQLKGNVVDRTTIEIAGKKSRSYRITYDKGKTQEIAFVLVDQTEYELLCRRPASESNATCKQLFTSFSL